MIGENDFHWTYSVPLIYIFYSGYDWPNSFYHWGFSYE